MAGDWIKIEHVTPDKPEVHRIAAELGLDPDAVVGKLIRLWIWADQQTIIGNAASVTESLLDRITLAPGFAKAMKRAGWLVMKNCCATFPNFDRHNGKTAKNRALSAKRVEKMRNGPGVTFSLPEKRREEINTPLPPKGGESAFSESFEEFWKAYPNSDRREDALQRWAEIAPDADLVRLILAAVCEKKQTTAWTRDGGAGIPQAWKWLKRRGWEEIKHRKKVEERRESTPEQLEKERRYLLGDKQYELQYGKK